MTSRFFKIVTPVARRADPEPTRDAIEPPKRLRYAWLARLRTERGTKVREWIRPEADVATHRPVAPAARGFRTGGSLLASLGLLVLAGAQLPAQTENEDWSMHGQATVIAQGHGSFPAAYSGPNSLRADSEEAHTATVTIFLGVRLWNAAELYFDPEVTQGAGVSGALGVAGFPNGEATRAGSNRPEYDTARLFLRQTIGLGGGRAEVGADANQLAGQLDADRLTVTVGKLSAADFFDGNDYSHDARTQLLNWSLMDNGAWDYPADTKGYTGGCVIEFKLGSRSIRWGAFLEPAEANGRSLDSHWASAHGQAVEWEERFAPTAGPATLRILAFSNRADMGSYAEALADTGGHPPDVTRNRSYRSKSGAGLNWEQGLGANVGFFARVGADDGRTETWAFTEIDRTISGGLSVKGAAWHRPLDTLEIAVAANGLAPDHRRYLAAGGSGFILGDGGLRYGGEDLLEFIYDWKARRWLSLALDLQAVDHPGFNRDRGPVAFVATRLHAEF